MERASAEVPQYGRAHQKAVRTRSSLSIQENVAFSNDFFPYFVDPNSRLIFFAPYAILNESFAKGGDDMQRPRGDNQQRILEFIKSEIQAKGYPPSVREIANAVGLKSTSTVHGHLMRLEKKGLLHRDAMKPRAMEVIGDPQFSARNATTPIPVIGRVTAGQPILAEENVEEYIPIPEAMLGDGTHFILLVKGESMIQAGIMDGDYVVVRKQPEANNGDIVVAMIEDSATVKRFYKENGHFRLQPENPTMEPIYTKELTILGKVVSLYRIL